MPEYIDQNATVQDTIQDLELGNPRNTVLLFDGVSMMAVGTPQALAAPAATREATPAQPIPLWLLVVIVGVVVAFSKG